MTVDIERKELHCHLLNSNVTKSLFLAGLSNEYVNILIKTLDKKSSKMFAKMGINLMIRNGTVMKVSHAVRSFSVTSVNGDIVKIQSTEDFKDKVINSKVPVVVDFFATWCNPCRLLTPRLESIISESKGKVVLAKVDIDEQTDLALDYEVSSVPVLVAIKNGKVLHRLVGLQDSDKLRKWIEDFTSDDKTEQKVNV